MDKTDAPDNGLPATDIDEWWNGLVEKCGRRNLLPMDHVKFRTLAMESGFVRQRRDRKVPAKTAMANVMAGSNDDDFEACLRLISRKFSGMCPDTTQEIFFSIARILILGPKDPAPADSASRREVSNQELIDVIEELVMVAQSRPPAHTVAPEPPSPRRTGGAEQRELEDGPCGPALSEAPEIANAGSKPTAFVRTEVVVDRDILVAFYNATNGDSWHDTSNWNSGASLDEWSGVKTSGGRVTEIHLGYKGLNRVSIPDTIRGLTSLEHLHLSVNTLTGKIPDAIESLTSLEHLDLSSNELTGKIPAFLGNLTNLKSLVLSGNRFTGQIPDAIGSLTSLEHLGLSSNELTGKIPAFLGNLTNLKSLVLSGNRFTGQIPDAIGSLTSLEHLDLSSSNALAGPILPAFLCNLTNLKSLVLSGKQLTGSIPSAVEGLKNLERLELYNSKLAGQIPDTLGNLTNLKYLSFSGNELTGRIPSALGNLTNLRELDLTANGLTGSIPDTLGNLFQLEDLSLSRNKLTGRIPASLGNLYNLERLHLDENELTGAIPYTLENLCNLTSLRIRRNKLRGQVPALLAERLMRSDRADG